jgi:hypothetical protein
MRRKGLDKLYDRLTPEERFRLDVEATARGDEEESRRLTEGLSAPLLHIERYWVLVALGGR